MEEWHICVVLQPSFSTVYLERHQTAYVSFFEEKETR